VGTQYRSVIFYHDDEQRSAAQELMRDLDGQGIWDAPLVTALEPLETFYVAEPEHQEYFRRNPSQPYCQAVVAPKVGKFRQSFAHLLRDGA
jgi:peptide-methionine (S)-S-oxide reductase